MFQKTILFFCVFCGSICLNCDLVFSVWCLKKLFQLNYLFLFQKWTLTKSKTNNWKKKKLQKTSEFIQLVLCVLYFYLKRWWWFFEYMWWWVDWGDWHIKIRWWFLILKKWEQKNTRFCFFFLVKNKNRKQKNIVFKMMSQLSKQQKYLEIQKGDFLDFLSFQEQCQGQPERSMVLTLCFKKRILVDE